MLWWLITIAIALAAVVCALATWWWLPKWQVARFRPEISDPKDRADVEDNFRKSIGQLIGGAAVILGAGLAYYQTQQTLLAQYQQSEKTLQAQEEQSKRTVSSQQVSKGFELLSEKDSSPVKRLSAIYLLESVMKTADHYNASVLDALSAFVRVSTANNTDQGPPATDVQAALTVISRHPTRSAKVVLAGAHIPQAFLSDANLIGADLIGIKLNDAQLSGINLSGASLVNASLNAAKLFGANLSYTNMNDANLSGAELISANLTGATLINATLSNANLNGANLSGAKLNNANLDNADLSVRTPRGDIIVRLGCG
jgi:uncharacterized protein YjbI with pentapeptide repeats